MCAAGTEVSFMNVVKDAPNYSLIAEPNKDAAEVKAISIN